MSALIATLKSLDFGCLGWQVALRQWWVVGFWEQCLDSDLVCDQALQKSLHLSGKQRWLWYKYTFTVYGVCVCDCVIVCVCVWRAVALYSLWSLVQSRIYRCVFHFKGWPTKCPANRLTVSSLNLFEKHDSELLDAILLLGAVLFTASGSFSWEFCNHAQVPVWNSETCRLKWFHGCLQHSLRAYVIDKPF